MQEQMCLTLTLNLFSTQSNSKAALSLTRKELKASLHAPIITSTAEAITQAAITKKSNLKHKMKSNISLIVCSYCHELTFMILN